MSLEIPGGLTQPEIPENGNVLQTLYSGAQLCFVDKTDNSTLGISNLPHPPYLSTGPYDPSLSAFILRNYNYPGGIYAYAYVETVYNVSEYWDYNNPAPGYICSVGLSPNPALFLLFINPDLPGFITFAAGYNSPSYTFFDSVGGSSYLRYGATQASQYFLPLFVG